MRRAHSGRLTPRLRRALIERAVAAEGNQGLFDAAKLTIGFSRRFAEYKRASLLLSDVERLVRILGRPGREVQLVFSGKAHPNDGNGKELLADVVRFAREEPRMAFITDYDMDIAGTLVQGPMSGSTTRAGSSRPAAPAA